jgi:hypothetical protein
MYGGSSIPGGAPLTETAGAQTGKIKLGGDERWFEAKRICIVAQSLSPVLASRARWRGCGSAFD